MKNFVIIAIVGSVMSLVSCNKKGCTDATAINYVLEATKDDGSCQYAQPDATESGKVTLVLEHQWENETVPFSLESELTHSVTGDQLTFTLLKYYVSNIRLKDENGTWWSQPESYHLVDFSQPTTTQINVSNIPAGNYTEISYIMGVDSIRNVSGAQSGALSTTHGMFWSWNTGYIHLKAEGTSPQSTNGNAFTYHLGGFAGTNNIVTLKNGNFGGQKLIVSKTSNGKVKIGLDISELFTNTGSVASLANIHMAGPNAVSMGGGFFDNGIFFKSIEN